MGEDKGQKVLAQTSQLLVWAFCFLRYDSRCAAAKSA